jgi:hypothetical protein
METIFSFKVSSSQIGKAKLKVGEWLLVTSHKSIVISNYNLLLGNRIGFVIRLLLVQDLTNLLR